MAEVLMRLGFRRVLPVLVLAFGACLTASAGAAHRVFHITNNASQPISSLTMVYHLPDGSTVQQAYTLSVPLRVVKEVAVPHNVSAAGSSIDTTNICTMDLGIHYANGGIVWLRNENFCSARNIDARDTSAQAWLFPQFATPLPDMTAQPERAPINASAALSEPRAPSAEAAYRGNQYLEKGNFAAALPFFNQAIKLNPRSQIAYAYRIHTYFLMGQFQRSLGDADTALRANSENFLLHWLRGNTEWAMGLNDSAIEDYAVTAAEYPKQKIYMTVLSVLAAREIGDAERAKALLTACGSCTGEAPVNRLLQYLRGQTTSRDLINAASDIDQRIDAHAAVGFTLLSQGKKAQARVHFQWIVKNAPPLYDFKPIVSARLAKMK